MPQRREKVEESEKLIKKLKGEVFGPGASMNQNVQGPTTKTDDEIRESTSVVLFLFSHIFRGSIAPNSVVLPQL